MKKVLSLLITVILVLSLVACGGSQKPANTPQTKTTEAPKLTETPKPTSTPAPTPEPFKLPEAPEDVNESTEQASLRYILST